MSEHGPYYWGFYYGFTLSTYEQKEIRHGSTWFIYCTIKKTKKTHIYIYTYVYIDIDINIPEGIIQLLDTQFFFGILDQLC